MKLFHGKKLLIMSFFVFALLIAPANVAKAAVLQSGSTGAEVTALQQKLIRLGFYLGPSGADGDFGQYTVDAVKGIQSASGITTDGIVGSATNTKITEWLSKPAYGASTAHFSQSEFKCSCCGSLGGGMKTSLLLRLEALRAKLGGKSTTVNSGYRCAKHNAEVGGEDNSYHMKSVAADIQVSGVAPSTVASNAETIFGDGGLGRYSTFTHVDVRGYRARW
ncbi:D-Ala-D-Ala carboxypeptidase family metallohydrolase [Clostridium cellulovorans]|uniref:Peptidase M15A n=1 Tax=Clostridium cellulovorans (strain ATCC 35296 / DSM 3052 / OCM 3 / 743B) TaxID=573061 RepID=D9SVX7_CLOC7|nr:D-Ala-D-Ala carboxypeptidase family metallohydrolase [Clostridium cellulovorans]ADL53188.1 Peptidase M15A [Clostridium cellulovorans 743B]